MGLQPAQVLEKSIAYGDSVSPDTCKKHRLWGCRQPGYLGKASSMKIQSVRILEGTILDMVIH